MYKIMQKYSKKMMAVLSIFLMITFVASSSSFKGDSAGGGVYGRIGDTDVTLAEYRGAQQEWEYLSRRAITFQTFQPQFQGLPPDQRWAPINYQLGPSVVRQIVTHPEMYLLLIKEAEQMGVQISTDQFESALRNEVRTPLNGKLEPAADLALSDPAEAQQLRIALMHFMKVRAAFERAASTIKVSRPLRTYSVAHEDQSITAEAVEFPASAYESKVPAPTTQQVDEQFKKYADVSQESADPKTNPHGFGYRYPDRVKLQYLVVQRSDAVKAAEAARKKDAKSDYEWKRDAFIFYQANPAMFATTQPSTPGASASLSAPTTQPFEKDAEARAREHVVQDDADKLLVTIEQRIKSILADDYTSYTKTVTTDAAHTSSLGVPYNTYDYLQKLAASIQQKFGVLPQITAMDRDFHAQKDLQLLPGIGFARGPKLDFAAAAVSYAAPLVSEDHKDDEGVVNILEPSQPLHDDDKNVYFFRLTDAQKSHAPADKSEVLAQLVSDIKIAEAYALAQQDAKKFTNTIKTVGTIQAAAAFVGKSLIRTGQFYFEQSGPIPSYTLPTVAREKFIQESFDLLSVATDANPHPIATIELPDAERVVVTQLGDVTALWPSDGLPLAEARADYSRLRFLRQQFSQDWFNFENVASRLNFKEVSGQGSKKPKTPAPPMIDPIG